MRRKVRERYTTFVLRITCWVKNGQFKKTDRNRERSKKKYYNLKCSGWVKKKCFIRISRKIFLFTLESELGFTSGKITIFASSPLPGEGVAGGSGYFAGMDFLYFPF